MLKYFWSNAEYACSAGRYFGRRFKTSRRTTQGGPFSPKIFNVVMDAVTRRWLSKIMSLEVAKQGIGKSINTLLVAFYADDGLLGARDPDHLQKALDLLVHYFSRVGLVCNASKTKFMTCIPDRIRTRLIEETYVHSRQWAATRGERLHRRVNCEVCDKEMWATSLTKHLGTPHGVFRSKVLDKCLPVGDCTVVQAQCTAQGLWLCPV